MIKERMISLVGNIDKLTKEKIIEIPEDEKQEHEEHEDDIEMFNNTTITGLCCLPSICLKNNCDVDLDTNVEL
mgnify:CR=1 FL=1